MTDMPLVSFVMSVYNTKNFSDLDRSIQSILNQVYENIELIVCDDASTNGVFEYITHKYENDSRVRIIRNNENCGCGKSLNYCLQIAKGQYVARQDDDDYIDADKIRMQVEFLQSNPQYSFVSTGFRRFDIDGVWSDYVPMERPGKRDFRFQSQHVHAATVFTRECLDAVDGYRVAPETRRAEDYDLFMRLYAAGYKGYNIQKMLYYYNYPRGNKRKIKYHNKVSEAIVRFKGFRIMKLPFYDYIYVFRPLIAGLIPESLKFVIKGLLK